MNVKAAITHGSMVSSLYRYSNSRYRFQCYAISNRTLKLWEMQKVNVSVFYAVKNFVIRIL